MAVQNVHNYADSEVRSFTLRDFVAIAFRNGRSMVLCFAGVFLGALLVALLQPNHYLSGMKILVTRERQDPVVSTDTAAVGQLTTPVSEEELNSEVELLKSRDLEDKVVRACDLQHLKARGFWHKLLSFGLVSPETEVVRAVRKLDEDLKVDVVKKTNLIQVEYNSADPQRSLRVLSTLADLYLEKHVAVHRPPGALDFFEKETERYRNGLAEAEAQLADSARQGTVSPRLEKEAALQKLSEFQATYRQTQDEIAETQQRIHTLEQLQASTPPRIVTQVRNSDDAALLSQLRSNLLSLELKRTELLEKFQPSYRPVQELDGEIAQTRAALAKAEKSQLREETSDQAPSYAWMQAELAKARTDLAGLQARATAASQTVQAYEENAEVFQQKEIAENDLMRSVKADEDNYMLYLRKEEEARISDALDRRRIINVAIADPPTLPALPTNARYLTVLMGGLLALLMSSGVAFVSEYMASTFRSPDEVKLILNIPVLSSIPKNGTDPSVPLIAADDSSAKTYVST